MKKPAGDGRRRVFRKGLLQPFPQDPEANMAKALRNAKARAPEAVEVAQVPTSSEGDTAAAAKPNPAASADAAGSPSAAGESPSGADALPARPAGTYATPSADEGGGAGADGAGSAAPAIGEPLDLTDEQRAALPRLDPDPAENDRVYGEIEVEAPEAAAFRAKHPYLSAAADAWQAAGNALPPRAIRIAAKVEGFRRAGMAHPKAPTEHHIQEFGPEQLEQLLAEPNLVVELI